MSKTKKEGINRRKFLKGAATTTALGLGWGCLSVGLEAALKEAEATGKPLLTDSALNNLIANAQKQNPRLAEQYAQEAKSNLAQFCKNHFTLTKQQEAFFKALTGEQKSKIAHGIDFSVKNKTPFHTKITMSKGAKADFKVDVKVDPGSGSVSGSVGVSVSC